MQRRASEHTFVRVGFWEPLLAIVGFRGDLTAKEVVRGLRLLNDQTVRGFQLGLMGALQEYKIKIKVNATGFVDRPTVHGTKALWESAGSPSSEDF